jgi:hypothetical protein
VGGAPELIRSTRLLLVSFIPASLSWIRDSQQIALGEFHQESVAVTCPSLDAKNPGQFVTGGLVKCGYLAN